MREIKFRGYKKESLGCENCLGDLYEGCTELCKHKVGTMIYDCNHKLPKGWVVMQYTGLKDKNGKEIYEGNIVEVGGDTTTIRQVVVKYEVGNMTSGFVFWNGVGDYPMLWGIWNCEVIGNIYENSELVDKLSSKEGEEEKV